MDCGIIKELLVVIKTSVAEGRQCQRRNGISHCRSKTQIESAQMMAVNVNCFLHIEPNENDCN